MRIWLGLIKKALRKFEWMSLRNEIDAEKAWDCTLLVSRTIAGICTIVWTNFILDNHSNFSFFYKALIFFVTFLYQNKKSKYGLTQYA